MKFHQRKYECRYLLVRIVTLSDIEVKSPIVMIGPWQGMNASIMAIGGISCASETSHTSISNAKHNAPYAGMHKGHGLIDIGLLGNIHVVSSVLPSRFPWEEANFRRI
jgi:hypothetical protein